MGKIVFLYINTGLSGNFPVMTNVGIIYGLPKPYGNIAWGIFYSGGNAVRVHLNENGVLQIYLPHNIVSGELSGALIYAEK